MPGSFEISKLYRLTLVLALLYVIILLPNESVSLDKDQWVCIRAIQFYEKKYGIPKNLLYTIAVVESGRWDNDNKVLLPHPWSLNIEGEAKFFDNRIDAERFLVKAINNGKEIIDIGGAQINWYYHGHNFKKPQQLLYPIYNIAYAAYFLYQHYSSTKDWFRAAELYHSSTPDLGKKYLKKVKEMWHKVNNDSSYKKFFLNINLLMQNLPAKSNYFAKKKYDDIFVLNVNLSPVTVKK